MKIIFQTQIDQLFKSDRITVFIFLLLIALGIIHCNTAPSEPDLSTDDGEFILISIEPPLNSTLTTCDTIATKFYYKFPDALQTNDSYFTFYLEFRSDTIIKIDGNIYNPTKCADSCEYDTKKWQDTILIKCPANKLFTLSIQKNPVEMNISMVTSRDCPDTIAKSHICLSSIEYPQKYYYYLDSNIIDCNDK
jgi:hypothetical protein